jgi:subtilase family serine protease
MQLFYTTFSLDTLEEEVTNSPACSSEIQLPPAYEERQCNEYLKLGLMGTTFVYSSGDYGVEFAEGGCLNPDGTENDGDSGIFVPTFPSGCPYVLVAVCISFYRRIKTRC